MDNKKESAPQYRIGAVSRLTGIPPVTIRMWERRYSVTEPDRTPAGDRLYSDADVRRLSLLKLAVDGGHSISNAAQLSETQLEKVVGKTPAAEPSSDEPVHVAVVGDFLAGTLSDWDQLPYNVNIVSRESLSQANSVKLVTDHGVSTADIVVIELPLLDDNSFKIVAQHRQRCGARFALVVYQFASQGATDKLNSLTIQTIRAPVPGAQLARSCVAMVNTAPTSLAVPDSLERALRQPLPRKRFDDGQLATFSKMSTVVECECPAHMSDIVRGLHAFENYSEQCESENTNDAAMHQMLHLITAQARQLMEDALQALIEHEHPRIQEQLENS